MTSRKDLSEWISKVDHETLEELFEQVEDLDLLLCILKELSCDLADPGDVYIWEEQITQVLDVFVQDMVEHVRGTSTAPMPADGEQLISPKERILRITAINQIIEEIFVKHLLKHLLRNLDGESIGDKIWDLLPKPTTTNPEPPKQVLKKVWPWPIIEVPGGSGNGKGFGVGDWEEISPLKMFGYTVGKTNGWPANKRKEFLSDFMIYDLPVEVEKTYGEKYGVPNSAERLKAVANLLSSLIVAAKRKDSSAMRYAIQDWTDDFNFLKVQFYEGQGLKFYPWPPTEPK